MRRTVHWQSGKGGSLDVGRGRRKMLEWSTRHQTIEFEPGKSSSEEGEKKINGLLTETNMRIHLLKVRRGKTRQPTRNAPGKEGKKVPQFSRTDS